MRRIGTWVATALSVMVVVSSLTFAQALAAEPELRGEFVQGAMIVGQASAGSEVRLNGNPLKVSPEGFFVFGIGRDDVEPLVLAVVSKGGERWRQTFTITTRKFDIQRV